MREEPLAPHDLSVGASPFASCPACEAAWTPTAWLVADIERRPDLLAGIREGRPFGLTCPHCSQLFDLNAPLLVVRARRPRLLFSPSPGTQALDDHNQLVHALALLEEAAGTFWRDDVVDELTVVPRSLLAKAAAGRRAPAASDLLQALVEADTPWKQQYLLAGRLGSFGPRVDRLLQGRIRKARRSGDTEAAATLRARAGLLAGCRKAGMTEVARLIPSAQVYLPARRLNGLLQVVTTAQQSGQVDAAIVALLEAVTLASRRANPLLWAETRLSLAELLADEPGADEALDVLEPVAAARFRCGPWLALVAAARSQLAALRWERRASVDDEEDAIRGYEGAIAALEAVGDAHGAVVAYDALGFLHYQRTEGGRAKHLEAALGCFEAAARLLDRDDDPGNWSAMQFNIGNAYLELETGDRLGNLSKAVFHLRQAESVQAAGADPERLQETTARLQLALQEAAAARLALDPRSADLRQALAAMGARDWEAALTAYRSAIAKTEETLAATYRLERRREAFGDFGTAYSAAAYACLRLGRTDEAVSLLEAGRSRMLSEEVLAFDVIEARLPRDLLDELASTRGFLRQLRATKTVSKPGKRGAAADAVFENMNRDAWLALLAVLEKIRTQAPQAIRPAIGRTELLALAPPAGALVLPLFSVAGCCVVVVPSGRSEIGPDDLLWIDDFSDNDLIVLLVAWSSAQNDDDRTARRAAVAAVCKRLWATLAGPLGARLAALELAPGAPVLILPQGGLGLLPLHAAAAQPDGAGALIDAYAISYAPSAYMASVMQRRAADHAAAPPSFLGAIDPLGDLEFGRLEGALIAALFEPASATVLEGKAASSVRLREAAPHKSHVHFSSHAYYTTDGGNYSGLYLAHDVLSRRHEGLQAAFEGRPQMRHAFLAGERWIVANLDLSECRLLTLSACDSGRVDLRNPDEFHGLPAAFIRAGAAAVVSALWRVDDVAGMLLSQRLYQGMICDGLSPAQALRAAQRWLRDATNQSLYQHYAALIDGVGGAAGKERLERELRRHAFATPAVRPYADPYFWAPYVVYGSC